jgi:hypothetical protein
MPNTDGLILFGAGSEWFWSMLQFAIVAITLLGIYLQLRLARSANSFAQLLEMDEDWNGERLVRRRLRIATALRDGGPDTDLASLIAPIADFWENVGALVRAGHIDVALVQENLGGICRTWWTLLEPEIRRIRAAEMGDEAVHFEWLARELRRHDLARGITDDAYSSASLMARIPLIIARLEALLDDFEAMRTPAAPRRSNDELKKAVAIP